MSFAAPYLELIEELTLIEFLEFHKQFKPFISGYNNIAIIDYIDLQSASQKQICYFSSGMKQRVKLALVFFSETPVLIFLAVVDVRAAGQGSVGSHQQPAEAMH